ncbi:DUF2007 domain-containing protein [Thalassotalea sp. 1_MG-2023]|uniref:putative signal transducing protein n=1 Tax=Thalassotalea sp. 1_MG-2023 TaxID=3062680 RepID=UPI0026E1D0F4|nr:DUF2007 domain-containing protein [Thalassotalea sp. 1_MG-2023]MDO6427935.1 DUF2007 domain-containing protein [Thalassotalea sp. 1_MG-2023]
MKMVYTNEHSFLVNRMKDLIRAEGIAVFLKNEYAQGAMGEIAPLDCWPEVWVVNDQDITRAASIVKAAKQNTHADDWICNHCTEKNDASFDICWNCQQESL